MDKDSISFGLLIFSVLLRLECGDAKIFTRKCDIGSRKGFEIYQNSMNKKHRCNNTFRPHQMFSSATYTSILMRENIIRSNQDNKKIWCLATAYAPWKYGLPNQNMAFFRIAKLISWDVHFQTSYIVRFRWHYLTADSFKRKKVTVLLATENRKVNR